MAPGFTPDGFEMASGQKVAADVVIFGTGSQSGIDKLVFQKDGGARRCDSNPLLASCLRLS
jgi:hypothetical protein